MSELAYWLQRARQGKIDQRDFSPGAASEFQLLPADRNRVAVVLGTPSGSAWNINFGRVGPANTGLRMTNATQPVIINIKDHGALVQSEIRATVAGLSTMTVISVSAGDE